MIVKDTIRRLRNWQMQHEICERNPKLLIDAMSATKEECLRVSKICADRMEKLARAEEELRELADMNVERPVILDLWFEAERDKGCGGCWLSSSSEKDHPECEEKIRRWFACREALSAWVKEMYVRRYHFEE